MDLTIPTAYFTGLAVQLIQHIVYESMLHSIQLRSYTSIFRKSLKKHKSNMILKTVENNQANTF